MAESFTASFFYSSHFFSFLLRRMPISFLFSIYIMFISLCAFSAISLMALRHFSSLCPISYHFMFVFVFYFFSYYTLCSCERVQFRILLPNMSRGRILCSLLSDPLGI